jgi:RNA-binding protein
MKGAVQSVEVTCLVHATEDLIRVEEAVASLLPPGSAPDVERLEGHYGNSIVKLRYHVVGPEAEEAFATMASMMGAKTRKEVLSGLGGSVDEHGALFLRFGKQALVKGRLELGAEDAVRVKVKPRKHALKGSASQFYSTTLGEEKRWERDTSC